MKKIETIKNNIISSNGLELLALNCKYLSEQLAFLNFSINESYEEEAKANLNKLMLYLNLMNVDRTEIVIKIKENKNIISKHELCILLKLKTPNKEPLNEEEIFAFLNVVEGFITN